MIHQTRVVQLILSSQKILWTRLRFPSTVVERHHAANMSFLKMLLQWWKLNQIRSFVELGSQRRQRGRAVKKRDFYFSGPKFKSRPDRQLDLFSVAPRSNPPPHLQNGQLVRLLPVGILNHDLLYST